MSRCLSRRVQWAIFATAWLGLGWGTIVRAASEPTTTSEEVPIKARVVGDVLPPSPLPAPSGDARDATGTQPLIPKLPAKELQALVAAVALYPDEVLDNVLDAAQHPAAIHQAANLSGDKSRIGDIVRDDLPKSVQSLLSNNPQVLTDLDKDLLMIARLGSAVKAQPEDVVAAIREVRTQSAALASQQTDKAASQSVTYSLGALGSTYYGNNGVYAGTSYPCCCYYTYGMPSNYYGGYGSGGYGGYGYGYPSYGYGGYGYGGYGYGLGFGIARLTLGLLYGYPWYGYGYPYYGYGYGYPWYGLGYGFGGFGYPVVINNYYYGRNFHHGWGHGGWNGNGWNGGVTRGPFGGTWAHGSISGTHTGPHGTTAFAASGQGFGFHNGSTAFGAGRGSAAFVGPHGGTLNVAGAGLAGKTTIGNTTFAGAAGHASWSGSHGIGGSASGWANGSATVVGNSSAWHTAAAGSLKTNSGISAVGTHTGSGSLVGYQNGTYGFNRSATNTLSGNHGSITVNRNGSGVIAAGGGKGTYNGTTTITGNNGGSVTINRTYQNGQLHRGITTTPPTTQHSAVGSGHELANHGNNALSSPGTRLSGQTGADPRFGSQSFSGHQTHTSTQMASLGSKGDQGVSGLRGQFAHSGATTGAGAPVGNTAGFGNRFGGYGALNGPAHSGAIIGNGSNGPGGNGLGGNGFGGRELGGNGLGQMRSGALPNNGINSGRNLGMEANGLQNRNGIGGSPNTLHMNPQGHLGSDALGSVRMGNRQPNNGMSHMGAGAPVIRGQSPGFNAPNFGATQHMGAPSFNNPGFAAPRMAAPSFGGGGFGGGGFGGGGHIGGGGFGGGHMGGGFGGGGHMGGGGMGGHGGGHH